jgi:hypothetical protein
MCRNEPAPGSCFYPTLEDLQATAVTVVDEIGYGREVRDNVRGFVDSRPARQLRQRPGRLPVAQRNAPSGNWHEDYFP